MEKEYLMPKIIVVLLVAGSLFGYAFANWLLFSGKNEKHYPIKVNYTYTNGDGCMEADSVRGDTVYKDNNFIVTKNISNISFK